MRGVLHTGLGEGGVPATPGGAAAPSADTSVFALADDTRPSGQGNLVGGRSPAWHGAAPGSHAKMSPMTESTRIQSLLTYLTNKHENI